jgi:hypothetical protein
LPGAPYLAPGKEFFFIFLKFICRVPPNLAPGKDFFIFFKFLCRVPPNLAPGKDFFYFF